MKFKFDLHVVTGNNIINFKRFSQRVFKLLHEHCLTAAIQYTCIFANCFSVNKARKGYSQDKHEHHATK